MKFCSKCGTQLQDDATVCFKCGNKIIGQAPPAPNIQQAPYRPGDSSAAIGFEQE